MQKLFLSVLLLLAGCGGSVSTVTPVVPPIVQQSSEGVWGGISANGTGTRVIILEDGSTYGFYVAAPANSTVRSVVGGVFGTTSTTLNKLTGAGIDIYGGFPHPWSYTGTVSTKGSITMSSSSNFVGTYNPIYDQPIATLATIAGSFRGYVITGSTPFGVIDFNIDSSGAISFYDDPNCNAIGQMTPRASGKNIFDVTMSFAGDCKLGNTSVTGVALFDATPNVNQLYVAAANATKTDGIVFIGPRLN